MAISFISGFESGALLSDFHSTNIQNGGAGAMVTSPVRSGTYAFKASATSATNPSVSCNISHLLTSGFLQPFAQSCSVYLYIDVMPNTTGYVSFFTAGGSTNGTIVLLNSNGSLQIGVQSGSSVLNTANSATGLVVQGQWYRISFDSTGTTRTLYLDGTQIAQSTGGSSVSTATQGFIGYSLNFATLPAGTSFSLIFDDIVYDNSTFSGSGPDGKVLLLKPTADPVALNSWTNGGGGTTSIFEGVNNIPPVGVLASTNGVKIKNAAAGSNLDYVATMQTYTVAGVPSGATINAVMAICNDGEEVTTGTKSGSIYIASNPTQGAPGNDFNYGDDTATVTGTFPTGWMAHYGTAVANPSVTLGTAPTVAVRKAVSTNRVVSVDLIGLYVHYTPAAPAGTTQMGMVI